MPPKPYQYKPLAGLNAFRLVTILPGRNADPIRLRLSHAVLRQVPSFAALSYTWGDYGDAVQIECNGASLPVTRNLSDALYNLRTTSHSAFWIDAICINQSDNSEKSKQVRMMATIYSQAYIVIIWLGPKAETDDSAIDMLRMIYTHRQKIFRSSDRTFVFSETLQGIRATSPRWQHLRALLSRPWFSRVWIIQEAVLAKQRMFMLGSTVIEDELFKNIADCILHLPRNFTATILRRIDIDPLTSEDATRAAAPLENIVSIYNLRPQSSRKLQSLHSFIRATSGFQSSEPRDKIFALMGLAADGSPDLINYKAHLYSVLYKVVRHILTPQKPPDLISLDILSHAKLMEDTPLLPSWIPQWHIISGLRGLVMYPLVDFFQSDENFLIPSSRIRITPRQSLVAKGRILGAIRVRGDCLFVKNVKRMLDPLFAWPLILNHIAHAAQMASSLASPYSSGEDLYTALWRTLCLDHEHSGRRASAELERSFAAAIRASLPEFRYRDQFEALREQATRDFQHMVIAIALWLSFYYLAYYSSTFGINSTILKTMIWTAALFFGLGSAGVYKQIASWSTTLTTGNKESESRSFWVYAMRIGRRCFMVTDTGYMGLAPEMARKGDLVSLFEGSRIPFVVRPLRRMSGQYRLVGDAYVHGFMDGEGRTAERQLVDIELL